MSLPAPPTSACAPSPLSAASGPAAFYDLRQSRRSREGQERQYELGRQRLAVDVTRSYYQVIQQRQLLAVARQSLDRSESLRRASTARLEVGLVSKLDVYRAELQASQAQESMVRAETSLDSELERFRNLLGLSPSDPLQPEALVLPEDIDDDVEPVEILIQRALQNRLDLLETRDEVGDARRTESLAKQNLLPQLDLNLGVTQFGNGTTYGNAFHSADRRVNGCSSRRLIPGAVERPRRRWPSSTSPPRAHAPAGRLDVGRRCARGRGSSAIRKSIELQRKGVEVAEQQRRLATLRYQRGLASASTWWTRRAAWSWPAARSSAS